MGDYAKALGAKLRAIRQQQGLPHGVEQKSGGRWKAVVGFMSAATARPCRSWPNWLTSTGFLLPSCFRRAASPPVLSPLPKS